MRATATLLDTNAQRFLARHPLPFEALAARDDGALNQLLAAQLPAGIDAALAEVSRGVELGMHRLTDAVAALDSTLEGAARSTLGRMQDDIRKLNAKIIQAAKRKDETLRRQFAHARAQAFPGGGPQEREVGFVSFLNRSGPALVERLHDELPLEMGTHWLVTI
jgi:uncharacterized protein YllA (UPF0747 family)